MNGASSRGISSPLSTKEVEVLHFVARQFTNKEIARELDISCRAVEERLKSARDKLGAPDRRSAARAFLALSDTCDPTTCGLDTVEVSSLLPVTPHQEMAASQRFFLADVGSGDFEVGITAPTFLETYDVRFGPMGRLYAVVGLAALVGLLMIAAVAIAVVARMLT
ncbi:helix-turn-helix domain-containing protein [Sphingomonas sp. CCH18-H6]|uniref:helix-turn-helix domain-containing protein n=1 Tax=Sphingomonas sp. CCH18-H6 TaxID=1768787 RepID=UPI0009EA2DE8|nr:helix-turn-helix transcriptional regulator [Sphingomonas sp. CCH18-H6]